MPSPLVLTAFEGLPTVTAGDDLAALVIEAARVAVSGLKDDDVVVVAQKIVSKAEDRAVRLSDVVPSAMAKARAEECEKDPRLVELILRESSSVLRCVPGVIIVVHRRGYVMANAGIDASNVEAAGGETVLLLPEDPDASARRLRTAIRERAHVDIGLVINDSFGRAWRLGTIGTALGVAGMPGLIDLRGRRDRNGRELQVSELGVADEIASAASLMMGQEAEGRPIVHVRGFPYPRREGDSSELIRPASSDLFR